MIVVVDIRIYGQRACLYIQILKMAIQDSVWYMWWGHTIWSYCMNIKRCILVKGWEEISWKEC